MTANTPVGAKPRKSLGQHFLTDPRILSRIVAAADLTPDDLVVEIGPGRGALTRRLVQQAGQVIAVELDASLVAELPLRLHYPPNLTVVEADARTVDIAALVGQPPYQTPYKVVANLPYYAANPIIRHFLETPPRPILMVVMVQQEVAHNMCAAPGDMGILSVATQFYARPSMVCRVPASAFRPPPNVTSAVVKLELREQPAVAVDRPEDFFHLVKAGFSAPRKQLRNSLSHGLGIPAEAAGQLLKAAGIDGRRRAETLSLEEWGKIYQKWGIKEEQSK